MRETRKTTLLVLLFWSGKASIKAIEGFRLGHLEPDMHESDVKLMELYISMSIVISIMLANDSLLYRSCKSPISSFYWCCYTTRIVPSDIPHENSHISWARVKGFQCNPPSLNNPQLLCIVAIEGPISIDSK